MQRPQRILTCSLPASFIGVIGAVAFGLGLAAPSPVFARDPLTAIDSAEPIANGVKAVSLQGIWEERPMQSDLVAGNELWNIPRVSLAMGMGGWAECVLTYDLLRALNEGPQSLFGGGSPRLTQKFRWLEQEGLRPSLGTRVGFKWPAANEPFEVDSGDFAVALLASWRFGDWLADFNAGPAIYGDRFDAGTQNHTWVWGFGMTRAWDRLGFLLRQELFHDAQLAERWFAFWDSESGPFERLQLATTFAWSVSPAVRLTARYERSLIDTGIRQGVGVGWELRF